MMGEGDCSMRGEEKIFDDSSDSKFINQVKNVNFHKFSIQ